MLRGVHVGNVAPSEIGVMVELLTEWRCGVKAILDHMVEYGVSDVIYNVAGRSI